MLDVTGSRYQTLDIHRPRSHLPGFNSIDCSPSAPKIEFCEVNMKIRKWDTMICDDSTVSSGK
ncbi:hypothetical protein KP509_1Z259900 [Ceratopteris richardii]|nr:hypothetical protein KP509_1Z259900 [Ceratopteris richardii]